MATQGRHAFRCASGWRKTPPPLEGGGWGEGCGASAVRGARTPPPTPSLKEGEWFALLPASLALLALTQPLRRIAPSRSGRRDLIVKEAASDCTIKPARGQDRRAIDAGQCAAAGDRLFRRQAGPGGARRSASPSAPRAIAAPPSIPRLMRRISWRSARRSASTGSERGSPARCSSASTRTRCRNPRWPARSKCSPQMTSMTMIDEHGGYTPTPVISHAILTYNRAPRQRSRRRDRHHAVA